MSFKFDEKTHTYSMGGQKVLSTTQLLSLYTKPFQKEKIAPMIAKFKGMSPEKLLKIWLTTGDISRYFGDFIHKSAELYYIDKESFKGLKKVMGNPYFDIIENLMEQLLSNYRILEMERTRVSTRYKLGYTPDLVLETIRTPANPFKVTIMGDFKSTKYWSNDDYKKDKGKNAELLLPPFKEFKLRDIPNDKTALQTSIYTHCMGADRVIKYFTDTDIPDVLRYGIHIPMQLTRYEEGFQIYELSNAYDAQIKRILEKNLAETINKKGNS